MNTRYCSLFVLERTIVLPFGCRTASFLAYSDKVPYKMDVEETEHDKLHCFFLIPLKRIQA